MEEEFLEEKEKIVSSIIKEFEDDKFEVPDAPVFEKSFLDANIISVRVGTNTPCGGDAGHGGRTVIKLTDEGSTGWDVIIEYNGRSIKFEQPTSIKIRLYGDAEARTITKALEYIVKKLKEEISKK